MICTERFKKLPKDNEIATKDKGKCYLISIVIPIFNEQDVLPTLYSRLKEAISHIDMPTEIIFVNDGSIDTSMDVLLEFMSHDEDVRILDFSRNYGHQAALSAGMQYSCGNAVITMDADLQHPPELIPELIKKWEEGYDVVYTCRTITANATFFKNITSTFFYEMINKLSKINIPQGAADFRLLDQKVIESFRLLNEQRLFIRGLISWMGYRQIGIPYEAPERCAGTSKYTLFRMIRFAIDGITSFSSVPLYFSASIGLFISLISFIYGVFVIYSWLFTGKVIEGWTSLMVVSLFVGGIQLITLGILGVYIGRVYDEAKRRPRYLLRQKFGFDE